MNFCCLCKRLVAVMMSKCDLFWLYLIVLVVSIDGQLRQEFSMNSGTYHLSVYLTTPNNLNSTKVIILLNGFECRAAWYFSYADALAQAGYTVIQYDKSELSIVDDLVEVEFIKSIRLWFLEQQQHPQNYTWPKLDLECIGMAGHSRGGKLAALMYVMYPQFVETAYLIDPVDNTVHTPQGTGYPSAVVALRGKNKSVGITGAGISGQCNPVDANYEKFWQVVDQKNSSLQVIDNSGHMQFCSLPFWVKLFLDEMCGWGSNTDKETISLVLQGMIPWMKQHLKADTITAAS